ncbi:MAG: AhpC/TSA family protein [Rikenellaceae bacterium]|nr:AhpC/TSA family protein [Rikenellaceae bacterium]
MKNFSLLLISILCLSCSKDKFSITGIFPDNSYDSTYVYMWTFIDNEVIDSSLVTNGKFYFEGKVDSIVPVALIHRKRVVERPIIEKGDIYIDAVSCELRGTPSNNKLGKFLSDYSSVMERYTEELDVIKNTEELSKEEKEIKSEEVSDKYNAIFDSFALPVITENKDNYVGLLTYLTMVRFYTDEQIISRYELLGNEMQENNYARRFYKAAIAAAATSPGNKFTDFRIENGRIGGGSVSLSEYVGNGKLTLVDFWGSWCYPCLMSFPGLKKMYEKYPEDKFQILGISVSDTETGSMSAINKYELPWDNIINAESIPIEFYGIQTFPTYILFDPAGIILERWEGFARNEIEKSIENSLENN